VKNGNFEHKLTSRELCTITGHSEIKLFSYLILYPVSTHNLYSQASYD